VERVIGEACSILCLSREEMRVHPCVDQRWRIGGVWKAPSGHVGGALAGAGGDAGT